MTQEVKPGTVVAGNLNNPSSSTTVGGTTVTTTVTPIKKEPNPMGMHVMLPGFACVVYDKENLEKAIAENYLKIYIWTPLGMYCRDNLTHGRSVTTLVTEMPGLTAAKVEQDIQSFLPKGADGKPMKMPMVLLRQIVAFFKQVMVENKGQKLEAMAHIVWNPQLGYHIRIPEQTVSAARVSYQWEGYLGPDDVIVLDIHSHNDMGEYYSVTC